MNPKEQKIPVYSAEKILDAWYEPGRSTLVIKFHDLDAGPHRRQAFKSYLDLFKEKPIKHIIVDVSTARGSHFPKEDEFFRATTFPTIKGIEGICYYIIFPDNLIAMASFREWLDIGKEFEFVYQQVADLSEAYEIIAGK